MFSPRVVDLRCREIAASPLGQHLATRDGTLPIYPVAEAQQRAEQLADAVDEDGNRTRKLTLGEERFITIEQLRCAVDFRHWAERYCNPPEAPIWMADLSFKGLGGIQVGDVVMGWTDRPVNPQRRRKTPIHRKFTTREWFVPSKVVAISKRRAPIVRLTTASGRQLRCTADHRWSNGIAQHRPHRPWVFPGLGVTLRRFVDPVDRLDTPWEERVAGWLGGIYDGEGFGSVIAQYAAKNPQVHAEIGRCLSALGVRYKVLEDGKGYNINGGRQGLLEFLLWAQPVKRASLVTRIAGAAVGEPDPIVAVEPDGEDAVIGLETETGNYVAWGYASKNCKVNKGGERLEPLHPLWISQELVLKRFVQQEDAQLRGERDDGCLATVLKARQLGVSTLAASLLVHRVTTRPYTQALVASDVTDSSAHLFGMADIIYRHLPWFLRPPTTKFVNSGEHRHIHLLNETRLLMESGKAMRGQKVEDSGEGKGEMGRGKTYTAVHLSELASWENPDQIDNALFPGIPIAPYVVGLLESTARGRFNWWHKQWLKAEQGLSRFDAVFIPWYAEPDKWRLRAPLDWTPSSDTCAHAKRAEADAPRWLGDTISLSRDQLYWYERTKAGYAADDRLADFLTEYPAEPVDAFQYSGRSVFSLATRERIKSQARPTLGVITIEPAALAQERAALAKTAAASA